MPLSKKEIQARYYQRHKERITEKRRAEQWKNAAYHRVYRLRSYGITVEEHDAMLAAQGGHCKVCPRTELHIDHDHATGEVRGLLCGNHNRALGLADDSPAVLRALADYLEKK